MPYINESGLFAALESALRNADEPMDCVQLFDLPITLTMPHLSIVIKQT